MGDSQTGLFGILDIGHQNGLRALVEQAFDGDHVIPGGTNEGGHIRV